MFRAALFLIAKRKQSKCISTNECYIYIVGGASLMAQQVKNLPAMQETQEMLVQSLSQAATHSTILAWEILLTEKPGRL